MSDFDPTPIIISFPPDEGSLGVVDLSTPIGIMDDVINEATEQLFAVQLQVVSSVVPGSVILSRLQVSLCKIIDDDCK